MLGNVGETRKMSDLISATNLAEAIDIAAAKRDTDTLQKIIAWLRSRIVAIEKNLHADHMGSITLDKKTRKKLRRNLWRFSRLLPIARERQHSLFFEWHG